MSGIVITGYASLDHVIVLDGDIRPGRTTTILSRPEKAWPRLGGGPAYVAQAVSSNYPGFVVPISWIAADGPGDIYLSQLRYSGISCDGIVKIEGARTPIAVLAYDPNGDCACLYDPGLPPSIGLTDQQRKLIRTADWIGITIGPTLVGQDAQVPVALVGVFLILLNEQLPGLLLLVVLLQLCVAVGQIR